MSKDKYKVSNWSCYNKSLEDRYNINIWMDEDFAKNWYCVYNKDNKLKKGSPLEYSDASILFCLSIKYTFKLPYRGCVGFVKGYFKKIGLDVTVPCSSQLCKRGKVLGFKKIVASKKMITDSSVDSTGLKVYGEGEWKVRKHGAGKHRTWMKLHLATDIDTQETVAFVLTTNAIDDANCVEELVAQTQQTERQINSFRGDEAYDKMKVRRHLFSKGIQQIILPQSWCSKRQKEQTLLTTKRQCNR